MTFLHNLEGKTDMDVTWKSPQKNQNQKTKTQPGDVGDHACEQCQQNYFGGGYFSEHMFSSISVFISYLFHLQVYHGKCTDFLFFVNNVLGFAKKGNTKTLLSLP